MVSAEHQVQQRAGPEHPIELPDEVDQKACQGKDHQGEPESTAQHEIPVGRGRVVPEEAPVLGEAQQTHRHDVNGDAAQHDVEEGSDEE